MSNFKDDFYLEPENVETEVQLDEFYEKYRMVANRFRFHWHRMQKQNPNQYKNPKTIDGWIEKLIEYLQNELKGE